MMNTETLSQSQQQKQDDKSKRHPLREGRQKSQAFPTMLSKATPSSDSNNNAIFMNQSTIYRRHQSRVLKNQLKADDPRPKAVRVLAGLPGFRVLMGEYQPPP